MFLNHLGDPEGVSAVLKMLQTRFSNETTVPASFGSRIWVRVRGLENIVITAVDTYIVSFQCRLLDQELGTKIPRVNPICDISVEPAILAYPPISVDVVLVSFSSVRR